MSGGILEAAAASPFDAVSALMAVLTVIGAAISWWRSNLSKDARRAAENAKVAAEAAEGRAQKMLEQAERQAAATESTARGVEAIGRSLRGADLALAWPTEHRFVVRNNTDDDLTVVGREVDGSSSAVSGVEVGTIIRGRQSVEGWFELGLCDGPVRGLVLTLDGVEKPFYLSFAERP